MFNNYELIDLTHPLTPGIPTWSGGCGFEHEVTCDYSDCQEDAQFRIQSVEMFAGAGTHMDAPSHHIPGGGTIEALSLDDLITHCIVIDISHRLAEDNHLTYEDVLAFEEKHGKIPSKSFVIVNTGWAKFWEDPKAFRNDCKFPTIQGGIR